MEAALEIPITLENTTRVLCGFGFWVWVFMCVALLSLFFIQGNTTDILGVFSIIECVDCLLKFAK